jgi:hypothetical protein
MYLRQPALRDAILYSRYPRKHAENCPELQSRYVKLFLCRLCVVYWDLLERGRLP